MKMQAGFRGPTSRLGRPGLRLGLMAAAPGTVEPPSEVIAPSVDATMPSRRQHKLRRGTLPSDTITLSNPATAGSTLILRISANGPLTVGTPSGFTAIPEMTHTTGPGVSHSTFWRIAAGGETSVSWQATAGTATATSAELVEVQDAHATAPIAAAVQSVTNAGTATRASGAAAGGATAYDKTLALAFWACQAGSSVDATTARGFSGDVATTIFAAANDSAPAIALGSRLVETTGTSVSTEWTWSGDGTDENLLGLLLVRPIGPTTVPRYTLAPSRSQEQENAVWSKFAVSVSVSGIATPYSDGEFARKLVDTTTTAQHMVGYGSGVSVTAGTVYEAIFDLRAAEHSWAQVKFGGILGNAWANFNLATGVIGNTGGGAVADILSLGGGWYRCYVRATATTTTSTVLGYLHLTNNANSAVGEPSYAAGTPGGVYVAGWMPYVGPTHRPYQRVAAAGVYSQPYIAGVQEAATVVV